MRERSGPRSFQAVDIILLHLTCACFPSIKQIQSIIASPRSSTSLFNFLSKRRFFAACCCRSTARSNASFLLSNGMTSFRNNERAPGKKESLLGVHRDEGPLMRRKHSMFGGFLFFFHALSHNHVQQVVLHRVKITLEIQRTCTVVDNNSSRWPRM